MRPGPRYPSSSRPRRCEIASPRVARLRCSSLIPNVFAKNLRVLCVFRMRSVRRSPLITAMTVVGIVSSPAGSLGGYSLLKNKRRNQQTDHEARSGGQVTGHVQRRCSRHDGRIRRSSQPRCVAAPDHMQRVDRDHRRFDLIEREAAALALRGEAARRGEVRKAGVGVLDVRGEELPKPAFGALRRREVRGRRRAGRRWSAARDGLGRVQVWEYGRRFGQGVIGPAPFVKPVGRSAHTRIRAPRVRRAHRAVQGARGARSSGQAQAGELARLVARGRAPRTRNRRRGRGDSRTSGRVTFT